MGVALECRRLKHKIGLARRWWTRPQRPYQPLFIVATCRSGSNLLLSQLRQQPGVNMRGELLYPGTPFGVRRDQTPPARAIKHIRYSLHAEHATIRGCKLMLYQLANCQLGIDDVRDAFPTAKYVILYRQNIAKQYVSYRLADATSQFMLLPGQEAKVTRIRVDAGELQQYAEHMRSAYRELLSHVWLAERSVLLSYEELVAAPGYWLRHQIGPLLGIQAADASTHLRQQNSRPLAETVSNYSHVQPLLANCRQHHEWPHARLKAA